MPSVTDIQAWTDASGKNPMASEVYDQYAVFAHRQYQAIVTSPELRRLNVYMERKRQEIQELSDLKDKHGRSVTSSNSNVSSAKKKAETLLQEDSQQAESFNAARDQFLQ